MASAAVEIWLGGWVITCSRLVVGFDGEFIGRNRGIGLAVRGVQFGLTVGTKMDELHRLDRELRATGLVEDGFEGRVHVGLAACFAAGREVAIPDESANLTGHGDVLVIGSGAFAQEFGVFAAVGAANFGHRMMVSVGEACVAAR